MLELGAMILVTAILVGLSRLESGLFALSDRLASNKDFLTSVAYFGLINVNVVLILLLSFLIFRNVTKLVLERRRGVFGSRLRTKLVVAFVFFSLLPTAIFVYISARFITASFDNWFSERVTDAMRNTREAGAMLYKQDQRRLESLARIAIQRVEVKVSRATTTVAPSSPRVSMQKLRGFEREYGFHVIKVLDPTGAPLWVSPEKYDRRFEADEFARVSSERFVLEPDLPSLSTVEAEGEKDAVKGIAPVRDPLTGEVLALVVTEELFGTAIIRGIEGVLAEFNNLRPGAQMIRASFLVLLLVMTLLIVFAATWLGFYVAREITGPIQSLAEATREVALGNYDVTLSPRASDETGLLVRSFNQMTADLLKHKTQAEESQSRLVKTNEELNRRTRYMEVVFKHISAGVIAVDGYGCVTSLNQAAERLLGVRAAQALGKDVESGLGKELSDAFWDPIREGLSGKQSFFAQLSLPDPQNPVMLAIHASVIADEGGQEQGVVVVFDDATAQVNMQRVAAWREVARRIAHEIKNPITPIKLSAQRLLRRFHDNFQGADRSVFESCIETILVQVDSLRVLVSEFSKFSRLSQAQTRPGNMNSVIRDVANLYKESYPDIAFDVSGLGVIPDMLLDRDQMNRALVNVVTNAISALEDVPEGRWIGFRTVLMEDLQTVRVEVSDNGCGIPPEFRDRVLEPYFSTKPEGTGLGLAIVNQIVSDHGGYLRIGTHEPRGTTIIVELPVRGVSVKTS
jgi:two-component system nitrogen regulation sensor histidine kinase NtrY